MRVGVTSIPVSGWIIGKALLPVGLISIPVVGSIIDNPIRVGGCCCSTEKRESEVCQFHGMLEGTCLCVCIIVQYVDHWTIVGDQNRNRLVSVWAWENGIQTCGVVDWQAPSLMPLTCQIWMNNTCTNGGKLLFVMITHSTNDWSLNTQPPAHQPTHPSTLDPCD